MSMSEINDALNQPEVQNVTVSLVTLAGVETKVINEGTSIREFKNTYNLQGTKIVDEDGNTLSDNDVISEDMELFVSAPKKNG